MSTNLSILIRAKQLSEDLGISIVTLWRWRHKNMIPHPIYLGPRVIAWERSVIDAWIEDKRNIGSKS
jgi:predicted DNA-binding transcriptional regulator AlpA